MTTEKKEASKKKSNATDDKIGKLEKLIGAICKDLEELSSNPKALNIKKMGD